MTRFRAGKLLWEPAEDAQLVARYPHEGTTAIARDLGRTTAATYNRARKLGLAKSAEYLASPAACRLRREDSVGAACRFQAGHVPANKGLRRPGWAPGRMASTQFKDQPIGTERVSKDGYLERKVNDDLPLQARWRAVHLVLWEAAHGPVPKGHAVTFLNGDRRDVRLDNLGLISRRELMARNALHNLPKPLVETLLMLGALNRRIRRMAREEPHRRPA